MWYFARICVHARSWREFAKCCFAHFPSFFSVHVDTYVEDNSLQMKLYITVCDKTLIHVNKLNSTFRTTHLHKPIFYITYGKYYYCRQLSSSFGIPIRSRLTRFSLQLKQTLHLSSLLHHIPGIHLERGFASMLQLSKGTLFSATRALVPRCFLPSVP